MRKALFGILITLGFVAVTAGAAGYKVTKVIEVGPTVPTQSGGSVKWSPDGTRIAYFANNYLMISDTLGNASQVAAIPDAYPVRFEWVTGDEIAASLKSNRRTDSISYELVLYTLSNGGQRLVEQDWQHRWSNMPGDTSYEGPFRTLEGHAYYRHMVFSASGTRAANEKQPRTLVMKENRLFSSMKTAVVQSDHLIQARADGLYRVSWSGDDSLRLCSGRGGPGTAVSPTCTYVFNNGILVNREKSDTVDVKAYAPPPPPNTNGCGFLRPLFNPVAPELLFQYYCEGEDPYEVDRVAVFNYETKEFVLLDTLTAFGSWQLPEYAPNGRMIAFTSGRKAYIVWREEM